MNIKMYLKLLEALKIVKKSSAVSDDSTIIGKFQNKDVIKTTHTSELRGSEQRDKGLSNEDLIKLLKRIPSDKKLKNGYYNLVYKNEDEKYNMLVIFVDELSVRVVTILQQDRNSDTYRSKPGDVKLVLEKMMIETIIIE